MNKNTVKTAIYMNFVLLFCLSIIVGSVAVFAWFSGQGYQGKTMAYKKQLYIGAANSEITNYYGINTGDEKFNYVMITESSGFAEANLQPGSYVYIKTEVKNNSETNKSVSSLYLQNVQYSVSLAPYLFFGKNEPVASRESYTEIEKLIEGKTNLKLTVCHCLQILQLRQTPHLKFFGMFTLTPAQHLKLQMHSSVWEM